MTEHLYEKPFPKEFLKAVESYNTEEPYRCWMQFLVADELVLSHVKKKGFSQDYSRAVLAKLKAMNASQVITFGLAYDSYVLLSVCLLRGRSDKDTFEKVKELSNSIDATEKTIAADILLGKVSKRFIHESRDLVKAWIGREKDSVVLETLVYGINQLGMRDCSDELLALLNHPSWKLRKAVAIALARYHQVAPLEGLANLTKDKEDQVRYWATFGLHQNIMYFYQNEIIEAVSNYAEVFHSLLKDQFSDTRYEALAGLAMFKDHRALAHIKSGLEERPVNNLVLDAAIYFDDKQLGTQIMALEESDVRCITTLGLAQSKYCSYRV